MDRRNFTKFALSGLAFSFLTDSVGKAALPVAPEPANRPPVPATPSAAPIFSRKPYALLLEEAKAALDQHARDFTLRDRIAAIEVSTGRIKRMRFERAE